jgi:trehalose synthase
LVSVGSVGSWTGAARSGTRFENRRNPLWRDSANELTELGWAFLRPYIDQADAYVFTRQEYPPVWLDRERLVVIPPSIDPFSAKNCEIDAPTVRVVLSTVGLLDGMAPDGPVSFLRRDGTTGTLRRRAGLLAHGSPPPADAPIVLQVSRWDRLKDMAGCSRRLPR